MPQPTYTETYLRTLPLGVWHEIRTLPNVIGATGFFRAAADQILMPDYEIIIGRYYATFRIVRAKSETLKIMERIQKAI